MINRLKRFFSPMLHGKTNQGISREEKIRKYIDGNRVPWSEGYWEYRWDFISKVISDEALLRVFGQHKPLPENYAKGLDDRSVEYAWIFSHLEKNTARFLDAGSTFNFPEIINHPLLEKKEKTITTFFPEPHNFARKRISYVYADLRELPFKDKWFDEIVCQSTLEHIGMNNSMYGYGDAEEIIEEKKNYDYKIVLAEFERILKNGGKLLLTFPYGKFEVHGFFQQFDKEMTMEMLAFFNQYGEAHAEFFMYSPGGWQWSDMDAASACESFNPHTGRGKGTDGAAHSRSICCITFKKKSA